MTLIEVQLPEWQQKGWVMLVLFVNAYSRGAEGDFRFQKFLLAMRALLRPVVYFGSDSKEVVLRSDQLGDYLYDETSYRTNEDCRRRFECIEYIFVDGPPLPPWSQRTSQLMILLRMALKKGTKLHCNGWGHFALYFQLCTGFDRHHTFVFDNHTRNKHLTQRSIWTQKQLTETSVQSRGQKSLENMGNTTPFGVFSGTQMGGNKKADFQYDPVEGWLRRGGKVMLSSGLVLRELGERRFTYKSTRALQSGVVLESKFELVAFECKKEHPLLNGISLPFALLWKHQLLCVPPSLTSARIDVLLQSEQQNPLSFLHANALSTQCLCAQTLIIVRNWLSLHTFGTVDNQTRDNRLTLQPYSSVAVENQVEIEKSVRKAGRQRPLSSILRMSRNAMMQGESLRTKKETLYCQNKVFFGRSRLDFAGGLSEIEIKNYVQRTPSRPVSSHKFRAAEKAKWMTSKGFFNC